MSERIRACAREALEDGSVVPVTLPRRPGEPPREALVLLDGHARVRAYLNECRHLPVPIDGGSRDFLDLTGRYLLCGTHGALYEREDGYCFSGPCAGKTLAALATDVEADGTVVVLDEG